MNITGLHSLNQKVTGNTNNWKVNQELTGIVKKEGGSGKLYIAIAGKSFSSPPGMTLSTGMQLTLKVMALLPQPNLEIINIYRPKEARTKDTSPVMLSSKLLQDPSMAEKSNIAGLLNLYKSLSLPDLKALPGGTLALLKSLKSKLLKLEDLGNANKLKPAIKNSGIFLESKLASSNTHSSLLPGGDLKALLFQLMKSMETLKTSPNLRSYVQNSQNNATEEFDPDKIRALLKSRVEGALSKITANQMSTVDEFNKGNQRWFFELPINSAGQPLSIPMTIYRKSPDDETNSHAQANRDSTDEQWCAEFSLNLANSGQINVHININDMSASVSMRSASAATTQALEEHCDELRANFNAGGLILDDFHSLPLSTSHD